MCSPAEPCFVAMRQPSSTGLRRRVGHICGADWGRPVLRCCTDGQGHRRAAITLWAAGCVQASLDVRAVAGEQPIEATGYGCLSQLPFLVRRNRQALILALGMPLARNSHATACVRLLGGDSSMRICAHVCGRPCRLAAVQRSPWHSQVPKFCHPSFAWIVQDSSSALGRPYSQRI